MKISDNDSKETEINHLFNTLQQNGYKKDNIKAAYKKVIAKNGKTSIEDKGKPILMAYVPFYGIFSNKIAHILRKRNIRTVHLPPKIIKQMLRLVKDEQGLQGYMRSLVNVDKYT